MEVAGQNVSPGGLLAFLSFWCRGFSLFLAAKRVLELKPSAPGAMVTSGPRSADA